MAGDWIKMRLDQAQGLISRKMKHFSTISELHRVNNYPRPDNPWGAVLGGIVIGMVEEELVVRFPNFHLLIYGSLLIGIILLEPDGLLGLLRRLFRLFRSKREDSGSPDADQVLWGRGGVEGRKL